MRKKFTVILIPLLLVFSGMSIYFLRSNLSLRKSLQEIPSLEDIERKMNLESRRLKEALKKDLEERRRADRVSQRAMAKRLELEKNRQVELKNKLDQLEKAAE